MAVTGGLSCRIDVALLSHIGYNNLLGLGAFSNADNGSGNDGLVKLNHLLLPPIICPTESAACSEGKIADGRNQLQIDLKSQLNSVLCELSKGGTHCSTVSVKGKIGTQLTANHGEISYSPLI